jgi:hypothetical protein
MVGLKKCRGPDMMKINANRKPPNRAIRSRHRRRNVRASNLHC